MITIFSEVIAAKLATSPSMSFLKPAILAAMGNIILVFGYVLGIRSFKDIWIVTVISVTSIIILEPIMNYSIFREAPSTGASIGMVLGFAGLVAALF